MVKGYDNAAWEASTEMWNDWPKVFRTDPTIYNDIGRILDKEFSHLNCSKFEYLGAGGFNICFRMNYNDNSAAIIRFPMPGGVMFPQEKVRNEFSVMQFILEKTTGTDRIPIPLPCISRCQENRESLSELGPFIIMRYINHEKSMGTLLEKPERKPNEIPILNPDFEPMILETIYGKVANIVLSMSTLSFSQIGSIHKNEHSIWEVLSRPLSYSMNEIVQLGTVPRSDLPTVVYDKASTYFQALAELHLKHIISQRNEADIDLDTTDDVLADDFRREFVARFLFLKIVFYKERRKEWIMNDDGPFPLWCDDLRPENILMDDSDNIAGVIDWEFSYTAPVEYTYAPPWWLLLKKPEDWSQGIEDWCTRYEKVLPVFLEAMRKCEDEAIRKNQLSEDQRLSSRMRDSWKSGNFWIIYAARNNFAFDAIYWKKIDQRFFGATTCGDNNFSEVWRERLHLLIPKEKELMEECVSMKIKERHDRVLAWDLDEYGIEWTKRTKVIVAREMARIKREEEEMEKEKEAKEKEEEEEEEKYDTEGAEGTEGVVGVENAEVEKNEELEELYAKLRMSGGAKDCQEEKMVSHGKYDL
ncbi:hypothetical protein N7540_001258 [Penicillium herquei]|nr:hypothetical protein N7540_001258 [Penicillium herquei]